MESDIQKSVLAGTLTPAAAEALAKLPPGAFVQHKSWGFGQIDSYNFLVGQVLIHFRTKRGHTMQIQYAAESLAPVPADHILAQKSTDLSGVKARAKNDITGLFRTILQSYGGKATQDQIATALVPDVLTEAEFRRWIESAKKAAKTDGHFAIPTKKGLPFELRDGPISHADEYIATFGGARQLKHQIAALDLIVKNAAEFRDPNAQLSPVVVAVNDTCRKSARLHTSEALTLLLSRDELIEKAPAIDRGADAPTVAALLLSQERALAPLLNEIPAAKLRRVLAEFPGAFGEHWLGKAIALVLKSSIKVVPEAARIIVEKGASAELRTALQRSISEFSISTESLYWLCKERTGPFAELIDATLFSAILSSLERDQFSEKRDRKLHDLLLGDQDLLNDLIDDASLEALRDTIRKLLLTPVFEELNKRSLLGRIIRVYPELGALIAADTGEKQESLIVSWTSLDRRKAEFDEIVIKKIPENTKEIAVARSYGDLRENFEFKAAKEMQRVLMRRKSDMERDLAIARGTDFANPDTTVVSLGTIVALKEIADGRIDTYTILGAWDGEPEKGIISYQSALAQAIIGRKVGEQVNLPTETGVRLAEIMSIEAWKKAELVEA